MYDQQYYFLIIFLTFLNCLTCSFMGECIFFFFEFFSQLNNNKKTIFIFNLKDQQPIFTSQPSDTGPLFSGAKGILQCSASGSPPLTYRWLKNSKYITNETHNGFFIINQVDKNDVATYQCVATNPLGSVLSNKASLSIAYIERPNPNSYSTDIRVNAGQAAVLQVPKIDSYPPPTYEWYAGDALIIPNQKFAISKTNSLIILATEKSDEKYYYVKAVNINTGNEIRSKDIRLYVNDDNYDSSSSTSTIIEPTFVVKPVDTVAKLNDNLVKFDCILNAKPLDQLEITWYKDNQLIDFKTSKYRLYQMSRSIEIISISDQDAGLYTCSAKFAEYTPLNASAKLDVYIKPTFKTQPQSIIEVDIGKSVELKCDGISNPKANITWYKNSNLIIDDESTKNVIISELNTKLNIKNISKTDEAIYQCFISNEAGQISASSLVHIISYAPKLINEQQNKTTTNLTAFSESIAYLTCNVDGSPKPRISWQKLDSTTQQYKTIYLSNDELISSHGVNNAVYNTNDNGDLLIKNLNIKHTGWYKCIAENILGSVSQNMYLHVKKKTEIIEPPMNISVIKGQSALLKCTISKEDDVDADIRWQFNGIFIDFDLKNYLNANNNLKFFPLNGSLQIIEATNEDIGLYKCIVYSQAGNDSRLAYLNVVELPYPPENVYAELYSSIKSSANISWTPAFDGNSAIVKYILQAHLIPYDSNLYESTPNDWFVIKDNILNNGQRWTLVSDLMPAMVYQFRMSAVNSIGEGDVSLASNNLTIPEEAPSASPRNIQAQAISSNVIQLQWLPPLNSAWNGKLQGYVIAYSLSYPNSVWKYVKINDYTINIANISDLIVWETYLIKICAFNSRGNGVYNEPIIRVRTKEGIPIRAPLNFKANSINSTCISMSWNAPPPQFVNGIILGYKLNITISSSNQSQIRVIDTSSPNFIANNSNIQYSECNLLKFTQYTLSSLAYTSSGDGPSTSPIKLTTLEDVPGEVNTINFLNVYDTSIDIEWEAPLQPNGHILSYILSYRVINSTKPSASYVTLNSTQTNYTISNLKASTEYIIGIRARTQAGDGVEKLTQIKSGVPPELPEPPKAIVIKNIAQKSVQLEFIPGYNGKTSINKWIVEALYDSSKLWKRIYERYAPNATSLIVNNLQPFTNYTLRMIASNIKGLSEPSVQTQMFQTLPDVPSQTPAYIYARAINQTSLYIKWTPISTRNWNGIPYGYVLIYNKTQKIEIKTLKSDYILTNLRPWTSYDIKIAAYNSVGLSGFTSIIYANTSEYVPSKGPTNVNAYSFNYTAIRISWDPIDTYSLNGVLLGYKIRCTKTSSLRKSENYDDYDSATSMIVYKQVSFSQLDALVSGLDGYVDYKIEIAGVTRLGVGVFSSPVYMRTLEYIPSKPQNIYFKNVNLNSVTITWSKPFKLNGILRGYRLSYQKYNQNTKLNNNNNQDLVITSGSGVGDFKVYYFDSTFENFTINGLHKMEYYLFKLCANTTIGWGEEAFALVYTIDKRDYPEPPSQPVISKSSIKSREMTLSWNRGSENYSPIRYYTIQYEQMNTASSSSSSASEWVTVNEQIDGTLSAFTVKNLIPNTSYRFRISATNDIGKSEFSQESDYMHTKDDVPDDSPTAFTSFVLSSNTIRLKWLEVNADKMNGITIKYKIIYKLIQLQDDESNLTEEAKSVELQREQQLIDQQFELYVDYPQNEYIITNLLANGVYEMRICVINSIGEGPYSNLLLVYMQDALPSRAPHITRLNAISSNELELTWQLPSKETINGKLYGFKIYFIDNSTFDTNSLSMNTFNALNETILSLIDDNSSNIIIVEWNVNSWIITNLKPFTTYLVCMQLFNQAGDSIVSNLVYERTLESIPSPPKLIKFTYVTFTYLNVSWQEPDSPNGIIVSYEIMYENIALKLGTKIKTIRQEVAASQNLNNTLYIKDLEPRVEYKFQIRCRTSVGWSEWESSFIKTGPQKDSPLAPIKPNFVIINDTILVLEWKFYSKDYEYFLIRAKYVDDDDIVEGGDENKKLIEQRQVNSNSTTNDEKFEFFAYTNQTRLEISRDQLKGSCYFQVYAINTKGISEPSKVSDKLNLPQYSAVITQRKLPIYYNWWFLVILALSALTLIIIMILIMCLRGKNKKYVSRTLNMRSKMGGTQSTLIDADQLYLPADAINQASSVYELRQSKRSLHHANAGDTTSNANNTSTIRSLYASNYLIPNNTIGKMSTYKGGGANGGDTLKSIIKEPKHVQVLNEYCTASKIGLILNDTKAINGGNIYNTGTVRSNGRMIYLNNPNNIDNGTVKLIDRQLDMKTTSNINDFSDTDNESQCGGGGGIAANSATLVSTGDGGLVNKNFINNETIDNKVSYTINSFGKQQAPYRSLRKIENPNIINSSSINNIEHTIQQLPLNTYATWKKTIYEPTYFTHQTPPSSKSPYTYKKQVNCASDDDLPDSGFVTSLNKQQHSEQQLYHQHLPLPPPPTQQQLSMHENHYTINNASSNNILIGSTTPKVNLKASNIANINSTTDTSNSNTNPSNPATNISISLNGDQILMNNVAGSRKPVSGFSSFV